MAATSFSEAVRQTPSLSTALPPAVVLTLIEPEVGLVARRPDDVEWFYHPDLDASLKRLPDVGNGGKLVAIRHPDNVLICLLDDPLDVVECDHHIVHEGNFIEFTDA